MANKGINKVILIGNVGNIESRATPDGRAIANVSIATSESWKDKSGMTQDKTEWHRVVVFGKTAEIASQYLKKGSQVYFEGKLATKKWEDKSGATRYTTEIIVDAFNGMMQMLDRKGNSEEQNYNGHEGAYRDEGNTVAQESVTINKIEPMDDFGIASSTITPSGNKLPF